MIEFGNNIMGNPPQTCPPKSVTFLSLKLNKQNPQNSQL